MQDKMSAQNSLGQVRLQQQMELQTKQMETLENLLEATKAQKEAVEQALADERAKTAKMLDKL